MHVCAHTENSIDTPNPCSKEKQGTLASVSQWGLLQSLRSQPVQEPSTTDLLPWQLVNPLGMTSRTPGTGQTDL